MIFNHVWDFAVRKGLYTFASLGIPDFDVSIIGSGKKFGTLAVESDILDRLRMT